jgi:hypothetical protein
MEEGRWMMDERGKKEEVRCKMLLSEHELHGLNEFISPALSRINRNITFRVTSGDVTKISSLMFYYLLIQFSRRMP